MPLPLTEPDQAGLLEELAELRKTLAWLERNRTMDADERERLLERCRFHERRLEALVA